MSAKNVENSSLYAVVRLCRVQFFLAWYKMMFLMSATKKGFSSKEIQQKLGLKCYEPVWAMVHKLSKAIRNKDARYTLESMIEADEGYFTIESSEIEYSRKRD